MTAHLGWVLVDTWILQLPGQRYSTREQAEEVLARWVRRTGKADRYVICTLTPTPDGDNDDS